MAGESAPRAFSEGSGSPLPCLRALPTQRRNQSVGHWRSCREAVTRKWITSQAARAHRGGLPPRAQGSRLSVNHQPARGPVRRTTPHLRATAALPPGLHPRFPPTSFLTSSRARPEPFCPSGRTAAPSSPWSWTQIWTRTRPAASQLCSLGSGTGLGLAKPVPAPSQVPPRPQEQVSLVKVKKKQSPEGEVLWSRASFKSQVLFPMEGSLENC